MMPFEHRLTAMRESRDGTVRGARDTHSTYLRIAAETGYPGLIFYLLMWGAVFWRVRKARKRLRDVRPRDYQFLFYLELAMLAFMVASVFGTYGALSFTYLSIGVAWLAAVILEKDTWYVARSGAPQAAPAVRRSR